MWNWTLVFLFYQLVPINVRLSQTVLLETQPHVETGCQERAGLPSNQTQPHHIGAGSSLEMVNHLIHTILCGQLVN